MAAFRWRRLCVLALLPLLAVDASSFPHALTDAQEVELKEHLPFGLPSDGTLLFRRGYVVSHNNWLKIPNWTAYHVSSTTLEGTVKRENNFRADPELKPWQRAEPADYRRSGYDQGHMAPAAAMKRSTSAMSESFLLSNMAPQVGVGFNRGVWRILEDKVRDWAVARGDGYVFVGPVFKDIDGVMQFKLIGKSRVAVPTHCFMILVTKDQQGKLDAIAFMLPNAKGKEDDLVGYTVSIHEIERLTGLDFLDQLPDDQENELEAKRSEELWQ